MKCSFNPYEGGEKYIFISYSHSNGDKVANILEKLNSEGFRIWYDDGIEWGTEWPESIASHLKGCEVCMAFHSNASIISPNCRQEINYALKMRKCILSVYLEAVELSDGLDMQLSPFQSTFQFQYENTDEFFSRLIKTNVLQACKGGDISIDNFTQTANDPITDVKESKQEETTIPSIDTQMDAKLGKSSEEISQLKKRINAIKGKNFIKLIEDRVKEKLADVPEAIGLFSLMPEKYRNNFSEKQFTIPDVSGYKTILFKVCINYDYKTFTRYYTCDPIEALRQERDNDSVTRTVYSIEPPDIGDENNIIVLHFNKETKEGFINMGILCYDSLKISRNPLYMTFETLSFPERPNLSALAYDIDDIDEIAMERKKQSDTVNNEIYLEADIREDATIIIDPETACPVKRELYFDETAHEFKAKIKVIPYKNYFSFQIRDSEANLTRVPLSDYEIANCYELGLQDFPKDLLKAAEYYEKDGSAEALYQIAVLFRSDESIFDEDTYCEYLQMAVDAGCEKAIIEFAIKTFFDSVNDDDDTIKTKIINLLESVKDIENEGLKSFTLGYIAEKRQFGTALNYYYQSASQGFKPACARLGIEKVTTMTDALRTYFNETVKESSISDYCMGSVLFFGFDIVPQSEQGLKLLKESACKGCWRAAESLYYIYEEDDRYEDTKEALKWLMLFEPYDASLTNTLANKLIDGIGCDICNENDNLAFSLFQKAAEAGDKVAQNNLGWMYKNGRGCNVDYEVARQLFIKAERASSFYHLGDIYEHGLGVPVDIETAKDYYTKGAKCGSKKAKKRLKDLNRSKT